MREHPITPGAPAARRLALAAALAVAAVALAPLAPSAGAHSGDLPDESVDNGVVSIAHVNHDVLRRVEYPVGSGNTFLGTYSLGNPGAVDVTVRYGDRLVNVGGSWASPRDRMSLHEGLRAIDGSTIADRGITTDGRLSVTTAASVPADGGAYVTVSYWLRNAGDAPLEDVRAYPMVVPLANGASATRAAYNATAGVATATSDAGPRAILGFAACQPVAAHSVTSWWDVAEEIEADALSGSDAVDGEAAIAYAVDLGDVAPGETRRLDLVLRLADAGGSVLDAKAFCPGAAEPPLDPILRRPDFAVTGLAVEKGYTEVAPGVTLEDPSKPWTVRMTVANEGDFAECRRADITVHGLAGVASANSARHTTQVCLAPGESAEVTHEWAPATNAVNVAGEPGDAGFGAAVYNRLYVGVEGQVWRGMFDGDYGDNARYRSEPLLLPFKPL